MTMRTITKVKMKQIPERSENLYKLRLNLLLEIIELIANRMLDQEVFKQLLETRLSTLRTAKSYTPTEVRVTIFDASKVNDEIDQRVQSASSYELLVPITITNSDQWFGYILVKFSHPNAYTASDQAFLQRIAYFVAIELRKNQQHSTARDMAKAILQAVDLDNTAWLNKVLETIVERPLFYRGRASIIGAAIHYYDESRNSLKTEHIYPSSDLAMLHTAFPNGTHDLTQQLGLTGYCATTGKLQYSPDVLIDGRYIRATSNVRSEVDIPLIYENHVLAVLTVKSSQTEAFDEQDLNALSFIAEVIVMAMQLRQQHSIESRLTNQLSLVYYAALNDQWKHDTSSYAINVRNLAQLLRRQLDRYFEGTQTRSIEELLVYLRDSMEMFERNARKIIEVKALPAVGKADREYIDIRNFLEYRLKSLEETIQVDAPNKTLPKIQCHQFWLQTAFDSLITTVRKTQTSLYHNLSITLDADECFVYLSIRCEQLPKLAENLINKRHAEYYEHLMQDHVDSLILVRMILESYDGRLVSHTDMSGSVLSLSFPIITNVPSRIEQRHVSQQIPLPTMT